VTIAEPAAGHAGIAAAVVDLARILDLR